MGCFPPTAVLLLSLALPAWTPGALFQAPEALGVNQAVAIGLSSRPSIWAAREHLRSALANQSALSALAPTRLEFGAGTHPELGIGNDLLLAQPIDISGKTRAARDTGKAGVELARSQLRQTELDLQSEILDAYADALSAQALAQTGQDLADIAARAYDATKARIASGDLPPNQLLRADLELRTAKQTLNLRLRAREAAKLRLAASLGVAVARIGTVSDVIPSPQPSQGLSGRADLAQIQSEIKSAHADSETALASRWPDFEVQFARDYWDLSGQFVARLQFVWPFGDNGASRERLRQARADRLSAQATLRDRYETATKEIEAAREDFLAAQQASQGFDALTNDAKTLLQREEGAFAAGANSLLDVLDASRALRDVEESAAAAKTQWIQSEARYLAASGTLLTERA